MMLRPDEGSELATSPAERIPIEEPGAARDNHVVRGITFMIGATVMFAISNALSKWIVAIYPVGEVMFSRSLTSLIVCSAFMLPVTGLSVS